ncbi:beta-mannosidase [Anaerocolumna xylanovorans]|uniref:Beta-mannosidase B n=1 Tax=Anaerocolumna xylanovorans DSM 12503 TaxID=1121345 RepID=A0A1M7YCJ1_9FIRM|nr:sugar-binding domain-containing protein [Anaerocolumna xylanovorans]SHO50299.1 beta-mannosidase [Anaerocolumna xylanovorans DSM 12503]
MKTVSLNGMWSMKIDGENVYGITGEFMPAKVPGSVYETLLQLGKMPDPYYRDNELDALKLMEQDFTYQTVFHLKQDMLDNDGLLLHFDGVDTLGEVYLNDTFLGKIYNMHRIWEFDIKELARAGENELRVVLFSPTKYIREEQEKCYTGGSYDCMDGYPHLRKAHCMFGWDWGPRLPDAGIFRDVKLLGIKECRFDEVYVRQQHEKDSVLLDIDWSLELFGEETLSEVVFQVTDPKGKIYEQTEEGKVLITEPMLWWPNGYGEQPLYTVKGEVRNEKGEVLDVWERRIGLRTLTIKREKDEWGESFCHVVNGVSVFAMGADYIPEDNILGRVTKERTEVLLTDCIAANFNTIRVWGGGYYPDDFFFDLCDELGLMVWLDFMYACASYELNDEFEANIRQETIENVIRIRHHACLAIWCGNNEMEAQVQDKVWKPTAKQVMDYIKIYEYIIPNILKEYDPVTFYWPSSPSSGGNYEDSLNPDKGDTHYWDVWHGNKPFSEYRKFHFRYASEFGFQSFPCLKTIESFTEKKDRNIFSRVMEMHQRNAAANGKILNYISDNYLYPKDFDHLIYTSQLLQADAIRYGVEHWRRHRGRCMGAIVWQLNDIWPVASWASIDYYGRWKALHYAEKRFFAPVMISCEEEGEMTQRPHCIEEPHDIVKTARLNVANETREDIFGTVHWTLRNPKAEVLLQGEEEVNVPALTSVWLDKLDFSSYDELGIYFAYEFLADGKAVSKGSCLFTAPKHFEFEEPGLSLRVEGDKIFVNSRAYARSVEISNEAGDLKISDNYFDVNGEEVCVDILSGTRENIKIRSVYDIGA